MGQIIRFLTKSTAIEATISLNVRSIALGITLFLLQTGCSKTTAPLPQTAQQESPPASTTSETQIDEPAAQPGSSTASSDTIQRQPSTATQPDDATDSTESSGPAESNSAGNSTDSRSNSSGGPAASSSAQGSRKKKPVPDANSTFKSVGELREKVRQAVQRKDNGRAFELATQAWDAARKHPKDVRLKKAADELAIELAGFGKQANDQFADKAASSATPLVDK